MLKQEIEIINKLGLHARDEVGVADGDAFARGHTV